MKTVRYTSGYSLKELIHEIDRIGGPPSYEVITGLEGTLKSAFGETQVLVHVITGSLKLSGWTSSDFDGDVWTGTIEYGGPSAGPNNPVTYAIYEMARGGEHDWFRTLPAFDPLFENAINKHLVG